MMHRYVAYGFGLFLGSLVMLQVYWAKLEQRDQMQAEIEEMSKPYGKMMPGEDVAARRPLNVMQAAFVREGDKDDKGVFHRVIIFDGQGERPSLRYEEFLWFDEVRNQVHLLKRQRMLADELIVRLQKGRGIRDLEPVAKTFGGVVNVKDGEKSLYFMQLPGIEIEKMEEVEHVLAGQSKIVAGVTRVYYIDRFDSIYN